MGDADDEGRLKARIIDFLGGGTRNGLHGTNGLKQAVDLDNGHLLDTQFIEDAVGAQSRKDISSYVRELYQRRVAALSLDPSELLKLQATLLLGLGEARYLTSEERRLALARTYRVYVPPGMKSPEGIHQFRDSFREIRRAERDDLIKRIADVVAEMLHKPQAPLATVGTKTPWEYEILEAQDDYIYPAKAEGQTRTVLRKRTIRSVVSALTKFRQTYTDRTLGGAMPDVQNVGQGQLTIENLRPSEENGVPGYRYDVVITFPPLQREAAPIEIAWLLTHRLTAEDQWHPGASHFVRLTPSVPIGKLSISVRFSAPEIPTDIWRIDNVPPQNALRTGVRGEALTPRNDRVAAEWNEITLGRTCGIVWQWPQHIH
ncbi:hypothetical protein [Sinomonas albida]|uniref:hypothetical protein n=1 Tax=Sinomonas albida TaxID=369942 RepID=UPI00301B4510